MTITTKYQLTIVYNQAGRAGLMRATEKLKLVRRFAGQNVFGMCWTVFSKGKTNILRKMKPDVFSQC